MAERVVLHVGTMKSGTTFLQGMLFANRPQLAEQGLVLPGKYWAQQLYAVRDLTGISEGIKNVDGIGAKLQEQIRQAPGTAVLSSERLGPLRKVKVRRAVEAFGVDGARVEVVFTVRDLNRNLISLWQESIQNGYSWTWQEYADGARTDRPGESARRHAQGQPARITPGGQHFWYQMGLARMVAVWRDVVGPENLRLVTVPPPGAPADTLPQRFGEAVGFDPTGFEPSPTPNPAVGAASVEVLRRLNAVLDREGMPFPQGTRIRKETLAKTILAGRRGEERVGSPVLEWLDQVSANMTRRLQRDEVPMIGDWADLASVPSRGVDPVSVSEAQVADAALAGVDGLRELVGEAPRDGGAPADELIEEMAGLVARADQERKQRRRAQSGR